jgi:M6 family metalloprotease-like protein
VKLARVLALAAALGAVCASVGGEAPAADELRAQHALGVQRVLVLAVSFPGIEPGRTLAQVRERVLEQSARYYAAQSWGKVELVGDVKGWYRLPRPLDEYKVSPNNVEVDRRRVRLLVEDAMNAAEREVAFDRYDHIIVTVGVDTRPGVGYGMIAYAANPGMLSRYIRRDVQMHEIRTREGQRFAGGIVVVAQTAHPGHIVHDLAHALGGAIGGLRPIPDLYDTVLQGKVGPLGIDVYPKYTIFMGPWDVMSRHIITPRDPVPAMSSFTRLRMGWIAADQVVEVGPGQSRTVTLAPLAEGRGTLVVKIPGRRQTYHLLEYRRRMRGDPVPPAPGLLVLAVDESRADGDGIVRVVDANPGVPDFGAATFGLGPGQTPSLKIPPDATVEVVSQQEGELLVRVTRR